MVIPEEHCLKDTLPVWKWPKRTKGVMEKAKNEEGSKKKKMKQAGEHLVSREFLEKQKLSSSKKLF